MPKKYWMFFLLSGLLNIYVSAEAGGDIENGKNIYMKHCAGCHGESGDGKGKAAKSLKPAPTDFTNKAFMDGLDEKYLVEVTSEGGKSKNKSPLMMAFKNKLKEQEILDVVSFIKGFSH